ncbi:triple gene block protein 3 [Pseudostellaria heterophylla carlavirus 3]|uniref:Movement protein TGBp3 n=1 Tax=Pseudostellaria heterophylla carlavirus 3 TaxID=2982812 RepID=A0A977XU10_9VIRU|nr:triple gene block protein 3 [Pseudostellaria heterophylla carlavirus 3]
MHDNTILTIILVTIISCIALLAKPHNPCSIAITGEAVRVVNCELSRDLLEFIRSAKPAGSC